MKKDNILGITVIGCGLLLGLSVFLPFVSYYSTSLSLWKMEDPTRIIYLFLSLLVMILYLLNKKTELVYLASGYGIFTSLSVIISNEGLEGLSIAFYLILMCSIAIGVITFLYDSNDAEAIVGRSEDINDDVKDLNVVDNKDINIETVSEPVLTDVTNQI